MPCNDTLELIATIALLTLFHKAVATVTSIYGLPEVMKNLRKILSIILLSYNAFGLQKLDTEPQTPRTCHKDRFQKSFLPLCRGRELRGCASFRCLSTWTSRTCRLSRHPLACSPFFPQGRAWLQKHASAREPAPKSGKNYTTDQIENGHAQWYPALLATAHADEEGVEAVCLAILPVSGNYF